MSQQFDKEAQIRAAKAAWAASPALRAEFVSEETYIAYSLADSRGAIKVFGARSSGDAKAQPQGGKQST